MKNSWRVLSVFLSTSILLAGCVYRPGVYVPPAATFDPTGTWYAENAQLVGANVEYGCRHDLDRLLMGTEGSCTADATGAYIDGFEGNDGAETFFGDADPFATPGTLGTDTSTPAVLAADSRVQVRYDRPSSTAYVNLDGTAGPLSNYTAISTATADYYAVQVYPDPRTGGALGYPFLFSNGCYYLYNATLSLRIPNDNQMDGFLSTRFEFANTNDWDAANPTCDEIFAALQYDWDTGFDTYENIGLLFPLLNYTYGSDGFSRVAALDAFFITDISAFQFNTSFVADRTSRVVSGGDSGAAEDDGSIAVNTNFIRQGLVSPAMFMSRLAGNEARLRSLIEQVRAAGIVRDGHMVVGQGFPSLEEAQSAAPGAMLARVVNSRTAARAAEVRTTARPSR